MSDYEITQEDRERDRLIDQVEKLRKTNAELVVRAGRDAQALDAKDAEIATLRVKVAARAAGNAHDAVTIREMRAEVEAATKRAEEEREEAMRFEEAGMKWLAERDEARASLASAEDSLRGVTLELDRTLAEVARLREEGAARDERIARIINGLVEAGGILMGHVQRIDFDPTASNVAREMWLESVALLNGDDGPRYFPPRAPSPKENDRAD